MPVSSKLYHSDVMPLLISESSRNFLTPGKEKDLVEKMALYVN